MPADALGHIGPVGPTYLLPLPRKGLGKSSNLRGLPSGSLRQHRKISATQRSSVLAGASMKPVITPSADTDKSNLQPYWESSFSSVHSHNE